ncbi:MAG: 2-C-methyl-D-erythritol 4-phosphate cytidylyltransferase [Candidatus Aminicenantes bacterium]
MNKVSAIIVAAGEGRRFGRAKQFALLKGKPVLGWTLEIFQTHEKVSEIILVLGNDPGKEKFLNRYPKIKAVVRGGEKRQDSVLSGFSQLNPEDSEIVLIHDGVRPLVSPELISRVIKATEKRGAVIPVVTISDTVKFVEGEKVSHTLEREKLRRIQTPQGFVYSILEEALKRADQEKFYGTDEASLVERIGGEVFVVKGDVPNIKITDHHDIRIAEALLGD